MTFKENILKEALRIEEDAEFSSEEHLITAHIWSNMHYVLGVFTAIFAVVSGGTALTQLNEYNFLVTVVAVISAFVASALASISTVLNPNDKATCHLNAGNSYRELRNEIRIFREIDFFQDSDETAVKKVKDWAGYRNSE